MKTKTILPRLPLKENEARTIDRLDSLSVDVLVLGNHLSLLVLDLVGHVVLLSKGSVGDPLGGLSRGGLAEHLVDLCK
jgi:hypothetical protein